MSLNVHFHEVDEGENKGLYVIFSYETPEVNFWHRTSFSGNVPIDVLKFWVCLCNKEHCDHHYHPDDHHYHTDIFSMDKGETGSEVVKVLQEAYPEKYFYLPFSACKEAFEMVKVRLFSYSKKYYLSLLQDLEQLEKKF